MKTASILFSILLVLLPIASAAELSQIRITGEDDVDGFYRAEDQTAITLSAALETDPGGVQADQIRIYIDGEREDPFDDCSSEGGGLHTCTYERPFTPFPGDHTYTFHLYADDDKFDPEATPVTTATKRFTYDVRAPKISTFRIIPAESADGTLHLHYAVSDRAINPADEGRCAGVVKLDLSLASKPDEVFASVPLPQTCDAEGTHAVTLQKPDGTYTVVATAYDALLQPSPPATADVTLDTSNPFINSNTRVYDTTTGEDIIWVQRGSSEVVNLEMHVHDPFLQQVTADLSALGGGRNVAGSINGNTITWQNIRLRGFEQCRVRVTAEDTFGHTQIKDINCPLRVDDSGPVVTRLTTGRTGDEGLLVGKDTRIEAIIQDIGSGVSAETVLLDARRLTGSILPAEECTKQGNSYTCIWTLTPTQSGGIRELRIDDQTTDLAGNRVQEAGAIQVNINLEAPQFGEPTLEPIAGEEVTAPVFAKDASFALSVPITNVEEASVDLSNVGGDMAPMDCTGQDCLVTGDIKVSGPLETNITVHAISPSGNTASLVVPIQIMALLEGEPNYWQPSIRCSPEAVDRQTASLVEQQVYCDWNLQGSGDWKPVQVVFDGFRDCVDLESRDDLKYVTDMNMLNRQGSTHPTLALSLIDEDYTMESLQFQCSARIYTRSATALEVNPNPEVENVTVEIEFYNQALGGLYENLDQQVKAAITDAQNNMEWVEKVNKFFDMASKVCDFKRTLSSIASGLDFITTLIASLDDATAGAGGTGGIRNALCSKSNKFNDLFYRESETTGGRELRGGIFGFIEKMCAFVNCQAGAIQKDQMSGITRTIGGEGGKFCQQIKETFGKIGAVNGIVPTNIEERLGEAQSYYTRQANFDIKNSIILSTACLCVPGLIHNLQKLREIKCRKAVCMAREVRDKGLPPSVCNDLEGYLQCNFIVGDIFSLFPPARVWGQATQTLAKLLANPAEALILYSGYKCRSTCPQKGQSGSYAACRIPATLAKIGDAIESVRTIEKVGDFRIEPTTGSCQQLDNILASMEDT